MYLQSHDFFNESCDSFKAIHVDGLMNHHIVGWRKTLSFSFIGNNFFIIMLKRPNFEGVVDVALHA